MIINIKNADFSSVKIGVDDGYSPLESLSTQKGIYLSTAGFGGTGSYAWEIQMFDVSNLSALKVNHSGCSGSGGGVFAILCDAEGVPQDREWIEVTTGYAAFKAAYCKSPIVPKTISGWTSGAVSDAEEQTFTIDNTQGYRYMWVMFNVSNTNPLVVKGK